MSYIPPTTLSSGSLSVNVTVFAAADHTKNITTVVTVSSYTSVLKGTFVLQVQGGDNTTPAPYQSTGAFVFDGKGNITSGEQILNTILGFSASYTLQGATGSPSTYFIGADGRGTITLNLQQTGNASNTIVETFSLVVLSSSRALVAEVASTIPTSSTTSESDTNSGSGTLELQDATAAAALPTGAYAFVASGTDFGANPLIGALAPTAIGGVFNIDNNPSAGAISGNGSLADQEYYDSTGTRVLESCVPKGSVLPPDSFGAAKITLTGATCFGTAPPATIQLTGFIVDSSHIRLIESDDINGSGGFLTAGIAIGQGTAAGTFNRASLSGAYVFDALGIDLSSGVPSSFTSANVIDADGNGDLTDGIGDVFSLSFSAAFNAAPISGAYIVDPTGRTQLTVTYSESTTTPPSPTLLFYLTGNGNPPLVFWAGAEDPNVPVIGTGMAYTQAANPSTLSFGNPETYGINDTQTNGTENDGSGFLTSKTSGISGTLTGVVDNSTDSTFPGASSPLLLLDTFTLPPDSFGRIGGTFMSTPGSLGPFVDYFMVDNNHGLFIETDLLTLSQVTLGYFSHACDVTSATSCPAAAAARQAPTPRVRIKPQHKGYVGTGEPYESPRR